MPHALNDLQFICPTGIYNVNNALYDKQFNSTVLYNWK